MITNIKFAIDKNSNEIEVRVDDDNDRVTIIRNLSTAQQSVSMSKAEAFKLKRFLDNHV